MNKGCYEQVKALTLELVGIRSVTGEPGGEEAMASFIFKKLSSLDYYKNNPSHLIKVPTENDIVKRSSICALIKGSAQTDGPVPTVICLGHTDTVGTEDFGQLEPLALCPDELKEALLKEKLPENVRRELLSGEYMAGRGTLDMKCGLAAEIYVLSYFSRHPEELKGAMLFIFECDEEGDSHGMLSCIPAVKKLQASEKLDFLCAVNTDFTDDYEPESKDRSVFLGTIGKYLPSFVIFGREAHAGNSFSAFDPNLAASFINLEMDYNPEFCESSMGETTVPPISLKVCDTKEGYNVQTCGCAYMYYCYFALRMTPEKVLKKCMEAGVRAMKKTAELLEQRYEEYLAITGSELKALAWKPRVMSLEEYIGYLRNTLPDFESSYEKILEELKAMKKRPDVRTESLLLCARLRALDPCGDPLLLVFLGGINYAPAAVSNIKEKDRHLTAALDKVIAEMNPRCGRNIVKKTFYGMISDSSFISMIGDIPVCNISVCGRDGHMFTERVDMLHSFGNVPEMLYRLTKYMLE